MCHSEKLAARLVVITVAVTCVALIVDSVAAQDARSPAVRSAMGKILTEDRVDNSAYLVCEQAQRLPDDKKYELLVAYVLPSEDHDTLRLAFDMTPTCPSPVVTRVTESPVRETDDEAKSPSVTPRFSGSEFVAPAWELIRVATSLGLLPEIRKQIETWQPSEVEDRKCVAAMLSALACAERNFPDAETHLKLLVQLAQQQPGDLLERAPEAFGLWAVAEHPEMRPLADELSAILYEDIRLGERHPHARSERWKRLVHAKRQSLLPAQDSPTTAGTPLPLWIPVSRMTAETRGAGYPQPLWQFQPGRAFHASGHDTDFLYYRSPLSGKFTVEADATTFAFRDIHLGFGGYWAGSLYDLKRIVNGTFLGDRNGLPINPPLTRMFDTMRVRMDVTEEQTRLYLNGRLAYTKALPVSGDPWLSLHSWWYTNGTVSNLRITGEPVILETVPLLSPDLNGWVAYYDETVGAQNADWSVRPSEQPRTPVSENREMYRRRRTDLAGTFSESLLRYHRPLIEDGTIEYEFFYEPGKAHVHPVLDRMCLILNPDGVDLHWATDGRRDLTDAEADNLVSEPQFRTTAGPLPLKPSQWNRLKLAMVGDTVNLNLNGKPIYSRPLEDTNLRTFGLFHWAEQTEVRVREMHWQGNWPKELPPLQEQSLADLSLETSLGDRMALKSVLAHDFREGFPDHLMSVLSIPGADWQSQWQQQADGIHITRPGGNYALHIISSPITLSGDFDIIAEYDQLLIKGKAGGDGHIELIADLGDERSSEHHIYRKQLTLPDRDEQITQAAVFEKRGGETQYSFFDAPPEESKSGRLRLVRRGTTLYSLIAETDSPSYRLIHRETVTQDAAKFRFLIGNNKGVATSVLWKSLDVRAAAPVDAPDGPLKSLDELDADRTQLPAHRVWDFQAKKPNTSPAKKEFDTFKGGTGLYFAEPDGLRVNAPGSDNWTATGLLSRARIEGDFDIELELDVLHLEPCLPNSESCVYLLTEFRDTRQTTVETKFSIDPAGDRWAKTQVRRLRRDKTFDYQEVASQHSADAKLLRLARRGSIVYQIFQNSTQKTPIILGSMPIGRLPVIPGDLRLMIHTGGDNRLTSVRFRTLSIWAEKLIEP